MARRWPGRCRNALQALTSRLRQAAGCDLVEYVAGGYRLAVAPAPVDAVAFEDLGAAARAAPAAADPPAVPQCWPARPLASIGRSFK